MFSLVTFFFFKGSDSAPSSPTNSSVSSDPHDDVEDLGSGSEVSSAWFAWLLIGFCIPYQ
jgi:hypothetical protein